MKRYLIRVFSSLLLVLVLVLHILRVIDIPLVKEFENLLYDTRVVLTAPGGQDEQILIIALDETSMEVEGHWPWTRDKLALMMDQLFAYGVALVGFDAVFPERDVNHDLNMLRQLGEGDKQFQARLDQFAPRLDRDFMFGEALGRGPSVMAYYFHTNEEATYRTGDLPIPAFEFDESIQDKMYLADATGYSSNPTEIMRGAYSAGFISNPMIDADDGIVRRTPLLHEFENAAYESLSLAMAATYLNEIALPVFVPAPAMVEGYPPLEAIELGERRIPLDSQGAVLVPYRGGAGSFKYISATDVIRGNVEDPSLLKDAIVIIGATAPGLQDLRSTPFGSIYPGVEIHANVLAGILADKFRWQPAYTTAAEMLAVVVFGVISAAVLPMLSAIMATVMLLATMVLAMWINFYLWDVQLHVLPLGSTLIVLFAIYMLNMIYGYFFESRSRSHMNELFGQYVPPGLVSEMAHDPTHYSMESQKADLSVLFTDIRGFTTISEKLDAQELSNLLNRFLTPMTKAVHDTHGTIDKYMGDCVMAFWGAPVPDPHHASNAVRAGLKMLSELDVLNEHFESENIAKIQIGVGVNTGTMSVGNMGSVFRRAYTVLGDSVNLGSRLEGLTKAYGVDMLVSEFTRSEAPNFVYREIDRVQVKGKLLPVIIYEVLGEEGRVSHRQIALVEQFEEALKLYREREWDQVEKRLKHLQSEDGDLLLYRIYLERIDAFRIEPPPEDWTGVFIHESK